MFSQFDEKKMLLEQFYNISLEIYEMFSNRKIDEAISLLNRKEIIIKKLLPYKGLNNQIFNDLKQKIKKQEEKNLELSKNIKNEIENELTRLNKSTKINNLYGSSYENGSIVDILE